MNQPEEAYRRTAFLLGQPAIGKLRNAHVAVFGLGGVGGYVVEALTRAGVGELTLVDKDTVSISNLNRQILATHKTLGLEKTEAARLRIAEINPDTRVNVLPIFYNHDTADSIDFTRFSYVVDCIDTVTAKLLLAEHCTAVNTPIIASMGTGNKLDPTAFEVADISKTTMCPLARVMRKELGKRGIRHMKVVYSKEEAISPTGWEEEAAAEGKRQLPGSVSFVPGAAGLILAGEVIKDLVK